VIMGNYYHFLCSCWCEYDSYINDFVIVSSVTSFSKLKVGDIIVFRSVGSLIPYEVHKVAHRIVQLLLGPMDRNYQD
jgi:hypothetical protein